MKTDRELLEMAAKAAGLPYIKPTPDYDGRYGLAAGSENPMRCSTWNPLEHDEDALQLAVKLKIDICFGYDTVCARGYESMPLVTTHDNPCSATRRAIVRAAAAIGEAVE